MRDMEGGGRKKGGWRAREPGVRGPETGWEGRGSERQEPRKNHGRRRGEGGRGVGRTA